MKVLAFIMFILNQPVRVINHGVSDFVFTDCDGYLSNFELRIDGFSLRSSQWSFELEPFDLSDCRFESFNISIYPDRRLLLEPKTLTRRIKDYLIIDL